MLRVEVKELALEAKKRGMWLFDPTYRKWYSPEDFEHIFSYANASDEFLGNVQVKHPNEGVDAGFKRLSEIQSRLNAFASDVITYYKRKSK